MNIRRKRSAYTKCTVAFTFFCLLGVLSYALADSISTASTSEDDGDTVSRLLSDPITIKPATQFEGNVPFRLTLDSNDFVGSMESYSWNFGDGEMAQGPVATHTFVSAGTYSVILTAKEKSGHVREELILVSVTSRR
jgi:PKD repeat protein